MGGHQHPPSWAAEGPLPLPKNPADPAEPGLAGVGGRGCVGARQAVPGGSSLGVSTRRAFLPAPRPRSPLVLKYRGESIARTPLPLARRPPRLGPAAAGLCGTPKTLPGWGARSEPRPPPDLQSRREAGGAAYFPRLVSFLFFFWVFGVFFIFCLVFFSFLRFLFVFLSFFVFKLLFSTSLQPPRAGVAGGRPASRVAALPVRRSREGWMGWESGCSPRPPPLLLGRGSGDRLPPSRLWGFWFPSPRQGATVPLRGGASTRCHPPRAAPASLGHPSVPGEGTTWPLTGNELLYWCGLSFLPGAWGVLLTGPADPRAVLGGGGSVAAPLRLLFLGPFPSPSSRSSNLIF